MANLKVNTVLVAVSTLLLTVLNGFAIFAYNVMDKEIENRKQESIALKLDLKSLIADHKQESIVLRNDLKLLSEKIDQSVWTDSTVIWRLNNHINDRSIHVGE